MATQRTDELKSQVRDFWNQLSCDTQVASGQKFSRDYFDEIEAFRYTDQPFIHSFAQFSRYCKKRVLEVGFGAGTDFIQWLRVGARATGIDLTNEALANLTHRIEAYGLPKPEQIMVADAENLPFESDSFDLGYSFGVLHHSPNTQRAVQELVRVVRPGGELKIMVYNRRSVYVFNQWVKHALLRGKPWRSLKAIMWNHIESIGTKGYTRGELIRMLGDLPLTRISVHTEVTSADYLSACAMPPLNLLYRVCLKFVDNYRGWDPALYVERPNRAGEVAVRKVSGRRSDLPQFSGNRLGFFHCISATKNK